ncbi:MAG: 3-deoxy-D-manno-octulosonic acid kinase [Woeseia sp.]|nr:3-deoxy-D-manno-octulosonic acid kinase [Woeseia sp.]MBT8095978.1 3-deoxy-D-manno-octulosonic acid kinase [Woeseia sp.]NNE61574.1 3-deoxy-D-manno-octulosonic acid kinase [Woeseia sp.]NNL54018.1 3-deoxy-D-manno-octulosonic acid kinase [Woeseia sp.]
MSDTVKKTRNGAILYDTAIVDQISERRFTARGWPDVRAVDSRLHASGRGETLIVSDGDAEFVLRHYMRGGLVRHFVNDVYFWNGEEQTRSFVEWRLLHKLHSMGLPVPRPVAARYRRNGMFYTADLMTALVPDIEPLSERILKPCDEAFWFRLGEGLHRFHEAGACHADLNAYNVQIGPQDALWLLDFDRGSLRQAGHWRQHNLARLHRSLRKVRRLDSEVTWTEHDWQQLMDGYFHASRSA